jgi:hypothetical protein
MDLLSQGTSIPSVEQKNLPFVSLTEVINLFKKYDVASKKEFFLPLTKIKQ